MSLLLFFSSSPAEGTPNGTLVPSVRLILSRIGAKFADGVIEYRLLTSAADAKPRTYSAWVIIANARVVEQMDNQVQDSTTGVWYREETCQLRVPYLSGVTIPLTAQIRTAPSGGTAGPGVANEVWSTRSGTDAADGAVKSWTLFRRNSVYANSRTGGGL